MITIFTPSFADEADTNAQNLSVKEIVTRLDPAKFAVTMLHESSPDARIAARPNTRLLSWHKHGNTLRTIFRLLVGVPDVYFFPREGPLDAVFLKLRRSLRLKTALVTYVVSGGLNSQGYAPQRIKNILEADGVFANNTHLTELVGQRLGVEAKTIHSGIDRRYFYPTASSRTGTRVTVLYAGSMRPYKQVPVVVEQAARRPDVNFRIAGIGEEERLCKKLSAELQCRNVEFLGHLSLERLGIEMRNADIFLFPSTTEGHPQVLGQAAGSGLPVIARKVYRPDYVVDGVTGLLVSTDQELCEKLDMLIQQPALRRAMGESAALHAKMFDWDVIAGQWQEAFEQTVARRRNH